MLLNEVHLVLTVGLVRNTCGTDPSDEKVRDAVREAVEQTISGRGSLADRISGILPHDASLHYGNTKVVLAPVPHDPGDLERLEHDRKEAADRYFEQFDFGDDVVEDSNGWDRVQGQNYWNKVVFFQNEDGGDSIRGEFHLVFKDKSVEIEDGDYSL